uniref:Uncharacterized protein n=1 Tax=Avena sativa TaxID=4498 RepID=A0ACD5VJ44_AVESA
MSGACQLPMESRNEAKLLMQQQPELLMAAREGDLARLTHLLGNGHAMQPVPAGPGVVVNIEAAVGMEAVMDVELNKILHVVASSGDGANFLESARLVYGKASHLLDACNGEGDTPFHSAARAGMVEMVSQLIRLARDEGGGDRVKAVLGKQNQQGETALHDALRLADRRTVEAMVSRLTAADDQLARVTSADDTSPLYLAILLGHDDIAQQLHHKDQGLSYSGPNGQNALHAAVLRSARMTNNLLQWNEDLSKQGDKTNGSTPLHFAAACGFVRQVRSLVNADKSLAYRCDKDGSFPIHVAVFGRQSSVVCELLRKCPDCAQLRDANGRTFLHIAAMEGHGKIIRFALPLLQGNPRFAPIVNMQDKDGNTVLHLAVLVGALQPFLSMLGDKDVVLNIPNSAQRTALDFAQDNLPSGVIFGRNTSDTIHSLLKVAGGRYGARTGNPNPVLDVLQQAEHIKDSTPTIGVVSALLVTITFAAAFTVPGGYRADGTPVLAASYSFQVFIIANNIALFCASMATISLMYAGITTVDIRTRVHAFAISVFFLNSSARSLAAAFAFGMYAALAPVAHGPALVTWVCMAASLLDVPWFACKMSTPQLLNRVGFRKWMRLFAASVVRPVFGPLWPWLVVGGFLAYYNIYGIH